MKLRDDDGFTLTELMIAAALSTILIFSVLSLLDNASHAERGAQARYDTILSLRQAMTDTTKVVRQATAVSPSSTRSTLVIDTLVDGATHHMTYDVSGGNYRITDSTAGGTARVLVPRVTSATPFCYDAPACVATSPVSPSTIRLTLAAMPDVKAGGAITLSSDVELRNIP